MIKILNIIPTIKKTAVASEVFDAIDLGHKRIILHLVNSGFVSLWF